MAIQHVWSIVCRQGIIDGRTNRLSLINISDGMTFHVPEKPEGAENFIVDVQHWSLWYNDSGVDEEVEVSLSYKSSDGKTGKVLSQVIEVNANAFHRWYVTVRAISVPGDGLSYWITRYRKKGDRNWKKASRIPYVIGFEINEDAEVMEFTKKSGISPQR
jgi:hypothetical protein